MAPRQDPRCLGSRNFPIVPARVRNIITKRQPERRLQITHLPFQLRQSIEIKIQWHRATVLPEV